MISVVRTLRLGKFQRQPIRQAACLGNDKLCHEEGEAS